MGQHWECRYCDRPKSTVVIDGDEVCVCGAEWIDAKILIHTTDEEDDAIIEELNAMTDEDWWFNDYSAEDQYDDDEDYDDYDGTE
jgi:hypothetical protein